MLPKSRMKTLPSRDQGAMTFAYHRACRAEMTLGIAPDDKLSEGMGRTLPSCGPAAFTTRLNFM